MMLGTLRRRQDHALSQPLYCHHLPPAVCAGGDGECAVLIITERWRRTVSTEWDAIHSVPRSLHG
jgi:hypothetical protein